MVKYCKCGCGIQINENRTWVKNHHQKWAPLKGKSYEDIYGKERAKEKKLEQMLRQKGKKLNRIKPNYKKGLHYDEIYGAERTKIIKEKIIKANMDANMYWTKEEIIKGFSSLKNIKNLNKGMLVFFRKQGIILDRVSLKRFFKSWEELAKICNMVLYSKKGGRYTKVEEKILDIIENKENVKILRQYRIDSFFVDGYDKENNIVYEIDGYYHTYKKDKTKDILRDVKIKKLLDCKIIRINEVEFLLKNNDNIIIKWN